MQLLRCGKAFIAVAYALSFFVFDVAENPSPVQAAYLNAATESPNGKNSTSPASTGHLSGSIVGMKGKTGTIQFIDKRNDRFRTAFNARGAFTLYVPSNTPKLYALSVQVDHGPQYGMAYSYVSQGKTVVKIGPDCRVVGLGKAAGSVLINDPLSGGKMEAQVQSNGTLGYQIYPWVQVLAVRPSGSSQALNPSQFSITNRNGIYYISASTSTSSGKQSSNNDVGDGFSASSFTSTNGTVTVTGANPDIHFLWFYVVHNGSKNQADSVHGYSDDGHFTVTIPLRYGTGDYSVQMFASKDVVAQMYGIPLAQSSLTGQVFTFKVTNDYPTNPLLMQSQDIPSDAPQVVQLAQQITAGQTSEYAKAKAIYDWVRQNITYDYNNTALSGWYQDKHVTSLGENQGLLVYEVLDTHAAECVGYAKLVAALNRASGIPTAIADGPADSIYHAWDYVTIDGRSFSEDACWGATDPKGNFDSDPNVFAKSHTLTQITD